MRVTISHKRETPTTISWEDMGAGILFVWHFEVEGLQRPVKSL